MVGNLNMSESLYIPKVKKVGIGYLFFKRTFDIFSSFLLLLLISWVILLLTIINCFFTRFRPWFFDKRVGRNGKTIYVCKLRSMHIDAESNPEKYFTEEQMRQWKEERKVDNDPRITKFGKLIRKTSLDELPQLFNILFGSMSVIGPRPLSQREIDEHFTPEQQKIYCIARPGLISNWAVNGRSAVTFEFGERQKLELEYYEKRSLGFDTKLLFAVIPTVLLRRGAK